MTCIVFWVYFLSVRLDIGQFMSCWIKLVRSLKCTQLNFFFFNKDDVSDEEADEKDDNFVLLIFSGSSTMKSSKTGF